MALEITDANIEGILANKNVTLVDFYADWCGPCRMVGPVVDKLSEENNNEDIVIGKLNIEENRDTTVKYGVRNIPTLLFFKGGEVVERLTGVQSIETLREKLETLSNEVDTTTEE